MSSILVADRSDDDARARVPPQNGIVLDIIEKTHAGVSVLLAGELDLATASQLSDALDWLCGAVPRQLTLDLSQLSFCDCAGISVFVAAHERQCAHGGCLILLAPQRQLRRLLTLTGLDRLFDLR